MFNIKAMYTIADEFGMRYEEGYWDEETHTFHVDQMEKDMWIHHEFFFCDSIEACLLSKRTERGLEDV